MPREQYDDIHRQSGQLQAEHAGEKRRGDRNPDEQRRAETQREQDNDHDQQHAGGDRVLQVAEHLPDDLGLVLGEGDVDGARPGLLQLRDCRAHRIDRLDQIGAGTLRHLDGHGGTAVDPRDRGRVLERGFDLSDVEQCHRRFRRRDDWDLQDVLRFLEQRGHLHREAPGLALDRTGGDQCVEGLRDRAELIERHAVAGQQLRIEDDLDCFVAGAAQLGRQHTGRLLDRVLGGAGQEGYININGHIGILVENQISVRPNIIFTSFNR